MKRGLFVPPFGELAHPDVVGDLARRCEAAGWDGFFVWDHVLYGPPADQVLDPFVALAVAAERTERLRLGAMVTPIPRRRPVVLARQLAALDLLSEGRMTLGVGIGGDRHREFSAFGEETDEVLRGRMLDEGLELVRALLSGETVRHVGTHYRADGVRLLPTPRQSPLPTWVGARWPNRRPLRRAAHYEGVFIIDVGDPRQVAELCRVMAELRDPGAAGDFDVVVDLPPDAPSEPWAEAGATVVLTRIGQYGARLDEVRAIADAGPGA